jgi:hypothetical protein
VQLDLYTQIILSVLVVCISRRIKANVTMIHGGNLKLTYIICVASQLLLAVVLFSILPEIIIKLLQNIRRVL